MSEFVRVAHGIWRPGDAVDTTAGRAAVLLSAAPEGTVLGGLTAAQVHRLWLPAVTDERVELLLRHDAPVPEAHAGSRRKEVRARRRNVHPSEVCQVGGLQVTTLERTWADLAEVLQMPDLVAAGDCALRFGASAAQMSEVLRRGRHRRGVVRARAALPLLDGRSASRPESHLRYAIVSAGLPAPAVNEPIYSADGEWLAEPDLSYDDVRLALEYNGADHATTERMRRDITREFDVAIRGGWELLTVGPAQVFRRPDEIVALVRTLRRQRARALPGRTAISTR